MADVLQWSDHVLGGGGFFRLEQLVGGQWRRLSRGISVNTNVSPGTYRVWVENIYNQPARYSIRWRVSAG